jgi:hypothetical protein
VNSLFPAAPEEAGNVLGGTAVGLAAELLDDTSDDLTVQAPLPRVALTGVLSELRDAAFVVYDNEFAVTGALDDIPIHGTRFVLISNADAELDPQEIFLPLLDAVVDDGIEVTIVALEPAPSDDEADAVAFVGVIRQDDRYVDAFATVDHAATFNGTLSALFATDSRLVVHLGSGEGASAELPAA